MSIKEKLKTIFRIKPISNNTKGSNEISTNNSEMNTETTSSNVTTHPDSNESFVQNKTSQQKQQNPQTDKEKLEEVMTTLREHSYNFAKTFPIWMKCNLVSNSIAKIMTEEKSLAEINAKVNWPKVNDLLHDSHIEYDYNLFEEINSIEELEALRSNAITASVITSMPWHKQICKTCGKEFTLSLGEIQWFQNKDLHVPIRCEYCRKGTRRPSPSSPITAKEMPIENQKTSIQIAFEKAGIQAKDFPNE